MVQPAVPPFDGTKSNEIDAGAVGDEHAPSPLDDDADVIDAEIVETAALSPLPAPPLPSTDYTDAGVPSLDYLRDRIEGRYVTALGSTELAQAAADREVARRTTEQKQATETAAARSAIRERAAKDKLDEIRRTLHP
jgi:hypothetical protein